MDTELSINELDDVFLKDIVSSEINEKKLCKNFEIIIKIMKEQKD